MGYANQTRSLQGALDEVAVYNRALTPLEVLTSYGIGSVSLNLPVAGPRLTVSSFSGDVQVSWTASASGFVLEKADNLGANHGWTPVSAIPQVNGGQYIVNLPTTVRAQFYRLRQP
jgi:hypothetical protein